MVASPKIEIFLGVFFANFAMIFLNQKEFKLELFQAWIVLEEFFLFPPSNDNFR